MVNEPDYKKMKENWKYGVFGVVAAVITSQVYPMVRPHIVSFFSGWEVETTVP